MILVALLLAQAPLDSGTFVIRRDSAVVGRESFRLVAGRPGREPGGWTLIATANYGSGRTAVRFAPTLEVDPDTTPVTLQYDVADPRGPRRILGAEARRRFTLRYLSAAEERARELPALDNTVMLDDSVFAFFVFAAWRATPAGRALAALYPRDARRATLVARDLGPATVRLHGGPATLRHVTLTGGPGGPIDLWLAPDGRLIAVAELGGAFRAERDFAP